MVPVQHPVQDINGLYSCYDPLVRLGHFLLPLAFSREIFLQVEINEGMSFFTSSHGSRLGLDKILYCVFCSMNILLKNSSKLYKKKFNFPTSPFKPVTIR